MSYQLDFTANAAGQKLTGLATPAASTDAVTKGYCDGKLSVNGGTLSGANNSILTTPTAYTLNAEVSGSVNWYFRIRVDGLIQWGVGGSSGTDTSLYRNAAAQLAADNIVANVSGAGETWHTLTLSAGWTTVTGYPALQYRKVPSPANCVQLVGHIANGTTKADNTTIATLPAGYTPTHSIEIAVTVDAMAGANAQSPHILIASSGTITIWGLASATQVGINGLIPLDA
jgi:hypothetical protein